MTPFQKTTNSRPDPQRYCEVSRTRLNAILYSVMAPAVVTLPILYEFGSAYQRLPSAPAEMLMGSAESRALPQSE